MAMTAVAAEKLVEVVESEVVIEFKPGTKCRSTLHLHSLHPTCVVAFKVQTSSPAKFHVNPPAGVLPPLSSAALHVILRPQPHPPTSFPRSPSDRFLIKASVSDASVPASHDVKLKVAYVGPFLLRHASAVGDAAAVRHLLRRQPHLLPLLPPEAPSASTPLPVAAAATPKGWTWAHAAAATGELEELRRALEEDGQEARDAEGRTPLMVAAGKGQARCVRELLERWGADRDARSRDGRTALYRAASNGDTATVAVLLDLGADPSIATARGRTPLDVARDKGHVSLSNLPFPVAKRLKSSTSPNLTPLNFKER